MAVSKENELFSIGTIHNFLKSYIDPSEESFVDKELFKEISTLVKTKPFPPASQIADKSG